MKKFTAIVLCALLAITAVFVLAACGEATDESIVTFRDYSSIIMFQGKTIDGYAIEGRKPAREGYAFDGWYKSLTADADGNLVYADKMDFSKPITEDLDLYAKWNVVLVASETKAFGYRLIGVINGTEDWNADVFAPTDSQLVHSNDVINLHAKAIDVVVGDNFKVKTDYPGWGGNEVNLGTGGISEVTLAQGVTLPANVTEAKALFDDAENITPLYAMNITVNFYYIPGGSTIKIVVNSITTA